MSYSFAIIGGGWYGCHIAASFLSLGFSVKLFEQHDRLLQIASGNNQFRLHQGFHYPRHYGTRMQSRDGFSRFLERYPALSAPVTDNLYAVPRGDSLIDFLTYRMIMTSSGIEFSETTETPPYLANIEGCLRTTERVLLTSRARAWFTDQLGSALNLGTRVDTIVNDGNGVRVNGEWFNFVVDATWGHHHRPPIDLFYEPTILLYYETNGDFPAITMVDGPLCSIYPTEDPSLFTLSSVPHTPLGRYYDAAAAREALNRVDATVVRAKCAAMEAQVRRYVPGFADAFRFIAPQLSIKTKPTGAFDDRSCHVYKDGRVFSVMSGKIDTIFFAVERILSMIEAIPQGTDMPNMSTLRDELMTGATHTGADSA